jgi:glycopeptide antibiotics resistance protein
MVQTGSVPAPSRSKARLSLVLVLYFLGIIGVITLAPFRFALPDHYRILTSGGGFDVVANILLFVPLGFLFPMTGESGEPPSPLRVLLLGVLLSGAIETIQLFEQDRYSSIIDVMTNASGTWVGAMLQREVTRRVEVNAKLIGRLSLEIPLIGLIYLLIPLLVVASMSALSTPLALLSLVPLTLVGARLLASVQRNHFGPPGLMGIRSMTLIAGGWTVLGTFPILGRYPLIGASLALLVMLTTWYESSRPAHSGAPDRRFEAEALRSAAPYLFGYFLVMIVLPLAAGIGHWRFELGLTGSNNDLTQQQIRLLEPVAALTVLGYLLAEARGRIEETFRATAGRVGLEAAAVAGVIEASRGMQRGVGASGVQFLLMVGAGLLGAGIYHHQRGHVRWILANRVVPRSGRRLAA